MPDPSELEDLEALIACPGYGRLKAKLQEEWGPAGQRFLDLIERQINRPDEEAFRLTQQVIAVRKHIEQFFASIEGRVQQLRAKHTPPPYNPSRRGSL